MACVRSDVDRVPCSGKHATRLSLRGRASAPEKAAGDSPAGLCRNLLTHSLGSGGAVLMEGNLPEGATESLIGTDGRPHE